MMRQKSCITRTKRTGFDQKGDLKMKLDESRARLAGKTRDILSQKLAQKAVDEAITIKIYNATEVKGDSIIKIVGQALCMEGGTTENPTYLAIRNLGLAIGIYREGKQNIDVVILKRTKGEE